MRPMRTRSPRGTLTPEQREAITSAADLLPPPLRYGFVLRIEGKLQLRGTSYISDVALSSIIDSVFQQMQAEAV